jgi:hypothetical protein
MIGPAISASGITQILVATKPVDFRKQADSLAALVQEALGADPFSGAVYVFKAKRADQATFSIPIAIRCRSISLASPLRPAAADKSTIGVWSGRNYRRRSS